jgi:P27 family predicted phage terminase small subunit
MEGNRGKRKLDLDREPQPLGEIGEPPDHLTEDQAEMWREVVRSMPIALLTSADRGSLERYAVAYAAFRGATKLINQSGLIIKGRHGNPVKNPAMVALWQASHDMARAGNELGLSPQARARITMPEGADADPFLQIINGGLA